MLDADRRSDKSCVDSSRPTTASFALKNVTHIVFCAIQFVLSQAGQETRKDEEGEIVDAPGHDRAGM